MKATVERTPESEAVLTISLEWAELDQAAERAYKRLVQKYNVPGFRKGHAPRSMLERMLGKETIYQEGLEDLIETSYRDAIKENDLIPVGQPTLDTPTIEQGQPYTYTARVPILTEPVLGDYRAIRVAMPSTEVTDDEIEHEIEHMREHAAMWLPTERPAQVDDRVTVNLKLTVGDKQISDLKDHEFDLAIERPGIYTGLDDHLVGMTEGQSAQFETIIPEDYGNPALAGKTGQYDVSVTAVKYRELPELDDEFAKSMGDYETMEGLRAKQREQLQSRKEGEARRELRNNVVQTATDQAEVKVHPAMVADEVDAMMREMDRMLAQNRLNLQTYLSMVGKSEAEYRAELEPEALGRVKRDMVLGAVADAENIQVDDEDLEGFLQLYNILNSQRTRPQDLTAGQRASIASRLRRDKAIDRLVEIATEGQAGATGQANEAEQGQVQGAQEAARVGAQVAGERESSPEGNATSSSTAAASTAAASTAAASTAAASTATSDAGAAQASEQSSRQSSRQSSERSPSATSAAGPTAAGSSSASPSTASPSTASPSTASPSSASATVSPAAPAESQGAESQGAETQALSGAGTEVPKSGA